MNRCGSSILLLSAIFLAASCSDRRETGQLSASAKASKIPTARERWTNSLGMVFAPVPETTARLGIWETRVQDFAAFVEATGHDTRSEMSILRGDGWKKLEGFNWRKPGFEQGPAHPVVGVSWEDAKAFCAWLTKQERAQGIMRPAQRYRLPTEAEWNQSAGPGKYPWGDIWPPPPGAGNYSGDEARDADWPTNFQTIEGYHDSFPRTAPVGSFAPNALGIYDLGGNVWEWCDNEDDDSKPRIMRGGSWYFGKPEYHLTAFRIDAPENYRSSCIGFRVALESGESAKP